MGNTNKKVTLTMSFEITQNEAETQDFKEFKNLIESGQMQKEMKRTVPGNNRDIFKPKKIKATITIK